MMIERPCWKCRHASLCDALTAFPLFARQALLLISALGAVHLLLVGCRRLTSRFAPSPLIHRLLSIGAVALPILANWWLLRWA